MARPSWSCSRPSAGPFREPTAWLAWASTPRGYTTVVQVLVQAIPGGFGLLLLSGVLVALIALGPALVAQVVRARGGRTWVA